jgi:hypothetical protein
VEDCLLSKHKALSSQGSKNKQINKQKAEIVILISDIVESKANGIP